MYFRCTTYCSKMPKFKWVICVVECSSKIDLLQHQRASFYNSFIHNMHFYWGGGLEVMTHLIVVKWFLTNLHCPSYMILVINYMSHLTWYYLMCSNLQTCTVHDRFSYRTFKVSISTWFFLINLRLISRGRIIWR